VPALEPLRIAAAERDALLREVVETDALRRSDEIKTAVLRSVSHDLRSPLTVIRNGSTEVAAGGEALRGERRDSNPRPPGPLPGKSGAFEVFLRFCRAV
jgi:two-component system sensor histidine kinase KdpD